MPIKKLSSWLAKQSVPWEDMQEWKSSENLAKKTVEVQEKKDSSFKNIVKNKTSDGKTFEKKPFKKKPFEKSSFPKKDTSSKSLEKSDIEIRPFKKKLFENKPFVKKPSEKSRFNTSKSNSNKLRIIPIWWFEEVWKNSMIIEYWNDIMVIDIGLQFAEDEMLWIDYVIPDISYLEENKHKIKWIFITHGHLDHIWALPHVLEKLNFPKILALKLYQ